MASMLLSPPDGIEFNCGLQEKSGIVLPESLLQELGQYRVNALVAWGTGKPGLIGISCGERTMVLRKKKIRRLVICHELPAKGSGSVALEAECFGPARRVTLLSSYNFSEGKLSWLLSCKTELEYIFGVDILVANPFYDC